MTVRTVKEHPIPGAAPLEITVQEQGQHTHSWLRQLLKCCELLSMYICCDVSLNSCRAHLFASVAFTAMFSCQYVRHTL